MCSLYKYVCSCLDLSIKVLKTAFITLFHKTKNFGDYIKLGRFRHEKYFLISDSAHKCPRQPQVEEIWGMSRSQNLYNMIILQEFSRFSPKLR